MDNARRKLLKLVTAAISAAIGAVMGLPLVRYLLFPVGRKTITSAERPVDTIAVSQLTKNSAPTRVTIYGEEVRDAWGVGDKVALGAAWVRMQKDGTVLALSTACPHLGCAIDYDAKSREYRCSCHKSAFGNDGTKLSGPAKRGMDPLPVVVEKGRVKIRFVRFRPDIKARETIG